MDVADTRTGQNRVKDEVGTRCQALFQDFLAEFKEDGVVKYLEGARVLRTPERSTLEVNFEDIEIYNQNLATAIIEEYYRIFPFLCTAVGNFAKDNGSIKKDNDYYVSFIDVPTRHKIRELNSTKIGTLLRITGQVVRTHPVHPELVCGTFVCLDCQSIIKDVRQQFKFTNPTICNNPQCNNKMKFMLDCDKSLFVDFQKVRIQEIQSELPRGSIPRSLEVILRAEAVETVQPGDRFDFTGTLIVIPEVGALSLPGAKAEIKSKPGDNEGVRGLKALGVRDMAYSFSFLACSVQISSTRLGGGDLIMEELTPEKMREQMTDSEWNKIYMMSKDKNIYQNLTTSLFPTIHGNDEVKKGIILMLFGGVPKTTLEGTSLRGDINCCIVGDPSTAKSQLLKQVADFSPRAVYTSGKASSAAGLTAAVVRDEESSDFVVEAGALMLADNGVCCIDEFDKMDPRDQVAIHEAMEQQTISIAKAGIRATLNARTAILAAANPIGGRYDRSRSLQKNIQLSAPIMSRFDLFFILVDECNQVVDYAIASKMIEIHSQPGDTDENGTVVVEGNAGSNARAYTLEEVLRYITFGRQFKPTLVDTAEELLVEQYIHLRQRDGSGGVGGQSTWRITVRQLESMIRLAEAMAKMECTEQVTDKHVKEAYRLLNKSIIRVEQPDIHLEEEQEGAEMEDGNVAESQQEEAQEGGEGDDESKTTKSKLTLSFEDYKTLSNMLILYLRQEEEKKELQETDYEGIKRSELVEWYLNAIEDGEQVDNETYLLEKKIIVEKVIDRLIYQDNILVPLSEKSSDDPLIVVHPNYIVDV